MKPQIVNIFFFGKIGQRKRNENSQTAAERLNDALNRKCSWFLRPHGNLISIYHKNGFGFSAINFRCEYWADNRQTTMCFFLPPQDQTQLPKFCR